MSAVPATQEAGIKISKAKVTNFRRVRMIELKPEMNFLVIGGENAQGKTSLLDGIACALSGSKPDFKRPVHKGEEKAEIEIELSNGINIRQYMTNTGGYGLKVKHGEGFDIGAGATFLQKFYSDLQFDPLAFMRSKAADQIADMKRLGGIDFSELDEEEAENVEIRKAAKKECARIDGLMSELPAAEILDEAPDKEISVAALSAELQKANTDNSALLLRDQNKETLASNIGKCDEALVELEAKIKKIKEDKAGFEERLKVLNEDKRVAIDTDDLRSQIDKAEDTNTLVRQKAEREKQRGLYKIEAKKEFDSDKRIEAIRLEKKKMLEEAQFPIVGLSFDEEGVLFNGIPLSECSSSERLRVCLAIAKATRKQMSVLIVRDGSLLDDDAIDEVKAFAEDNDIQILIEMVGEEGHGSEAIIIEDGMVKEAN